MGGNLVLCFLRHQSVSYTRPFIRLALDRLARFHAATYALIQSLKLEGFKSKYPYVHSKNNWSEEGETTRGPWLQMVIDGALKVLRVSSTTAFQTEQIQLR